jgi:alkylated DNA repair protein (DNA oxidative demethylase)
MTSRLEVAPGILYWPERFAAPEQAALLAEIMARVGVAPFYRPTMPGSGAPLSVEMTNFGPLGWLSDQANGYRYDTHHPVTGAFWPDIPGRLLDLWTETTGYQAPPEACLVNLYRPGARMGLHRDADEDALDARCSRFHSATLGYFASVGRLGGSQQPRSS